MSFDADEEILQDFLVEAGEILEQLSEQLVELESRPDDMDLLNAIFRGFHTVKGGAGFLQLNALVECCHIAENVFDILRKGERRVSSELMDVVLQALDTVNAMFDQVREQSEPTPATPELLAALARLAEPEGAEPAEPVQAPPAAVPPAEPAAPPEAPAQSASSDITDDEFEQLLDALQGDEAPASAVAEAPAAPAGDEISDAEFEALLDQLHGKGKFVPPAVSAEPAQVPAEAVEPAAAAAGDDISDDEFEALLDELHGKGKFGDVPEAAGTPAAPAAAAPAAAPAEQGKAPAAAGGDEISDDEFESLLDELHGKGKFNGASEAVAAAAAVAKNIAAKSPAAKPVAPAKAAAARPAAPDRPAASEAETTVRVDTARLDEIMNMVGELVLVRNRLVRLGLNSGDEAMAKAVANLDVVTGDLQMSVMKTRMQPIKKVFGRFPRLVRDLARNMKKEINLELVGEETDLDKNLVEALADPLVHLVRNAVDHGIESPEEREAAGKPRVGQVVLSAEQEGDHILLMITDDGKGMDAEVLRNKAVEKGLLERDAADRLTDLECYNLIFAPGFSTKTEISDVSGRGVGMDVVKTKISQLNGTVNVFSQKGSGSKIVIKVPLTLAIMPTLMVMLGSQAFAFPLVNVNEIFHLDLSRTNVVDGQEVVIVRDKALPLFYLKRWLVPSAAHEEQGEGHVVILSVGTQRIGFVVDQLVGQEEVVIKPLGKMLQGTPGMAGATITGDGRIALILDVPSMLKRYARRI
ncbi:MULTISPECIES: chemotaxis protein CheA [Pseudomonas]|jgi:two-component system chemotaxis sensor kinase CheA|uniref:Chemotaxis protein CheA n=3 Tax=Pseudomonas TaxID=286 RepID=G3XCT6_PSEAE|nr:MULTISPECIES: chemotaxis protein CheA [Pseudomonas]NP_250149.1 two-component sensor [Pseudomonas aeruginosa PAO1]KEA14491.1 chemotaxis protein CheA [Pseudomonas aeruginosa C2159M]SCZ17334.1 Chemotaxis protein CheA [Acinetobacter baumannii]VEE46982.1 two-component sensor [Pseudomonas fluorescens]HCL2712901.1 chemotaxis protein CheA [Pseudomonas aeruginosa EF8E]HCL2750590.1 chemotaxis protein CheA [Pseudomonas aeruginosa 449A]HCL2780402.1 chemotaxis protein CheA [Pseudomonas aeruginosa AC9A